jgi:phosphate/sulfate permease
MSGTLDQYLWIAIAGGIVGFIYTFGIGANDVANAFATSVASKSLTLKQAVVIATICEFSGALFLGASVTSTVRGKIFNADLYEDEPEIVMLGMFTSLTTASLMMLVATYFGLPVSTTHTVRVTRITWSNYCTFQLTLLLFWYT